MGDLHIAHVITGLMTGGAERMLSKVSSAMGSMGIRSTVIAGLGGSIEQEFQARGNPAHIIWRKSSRLQQPPSVGSFLRHCSRGEFSGFLGWMYHGNLLASMLGGTFRCPVAWSIRQSLSREQPDKLLTRGVIRVGATLSGTPRAIIYNSSVAAAMHQALGYNSGRSVVIPNGFDPEAFFPDADAAAAFRVRHGLGPGNRIVGLVARNHPMKDFPAFVGMAGRVRETRKDVRFLLVGRGLAHDGSDLRRLVATSGLSDCFLILDERTDLREVYGAMDVFCLSSRSNEAFPNVLGEAMFCGVPCVTTDVGDAATIVGEPGRVARPGDSQALAAAVLSILAMNRESYQVMARSIRERAMRLYSIDGIARRYAEVCMDAFTGRGRSAARQVQD